MLVLDALHVVKSASAQGLGKALVAAVAAEAPRRGPTQPQGSIVARSPQVVFDAKPGCKPRLLREPTLSRGQADFIVLERARIRCGRLTPKGFKDES